MLLTAVLFGWWIFGGSDKTSQPDASLVNAEDSQSILLENGLLPQMPRLPLQNEGAGLTFRGYDRRDSAAAGAEPVISDKNLGDYTKLKKPLLIHFWATWCGPCKGELPAFAKAAKNMRDMEVICIAIQDTYENVTAFYAAKNIADLDISFDNTGIMQHFFGVRSVPLTILIDSAGYYAGRISGAFSWENPAALKALQNYLTVSAQPAVAEDKRTLSA